MVAARENGFRRKERAAVVAAAVGRYREAMNRFAEQRELEVWYARAELDELTLLLRDQVSEKKLKRFTEAQAKARSRDSLQAFRSMTTLVDGSRRIVANAPLIVPLDQLLPDGDRTELEARIQELLAGYANTLAADRRRLFEAFRFVDMARKVSGSSRASA